MVKKTGKDPSAPKPPLNSYLEFAREERPRVLLELGKMSTTEVGKEIGMRWKKLHDDEKQKFVDIFRENQERYKVDKKNYEKSLDTGVNEGPSVITTPKTKKGKDPLAPKAPLSSYMEFTVQERPKILENLGKLSLIEVGKELGLGPAR